MEMIIFMSYYKQIFVLFPIFSYTGQKALITRRKFLNSSNFYPSWELLK